MRLRGANIWMTCMPLKENIGSLFLKGNATTEPWRTWNIDSNQKSHKVAPLWFPLHPHAAAWMASVLLTSLHQFWEKGSEVLNFKEKPKCLWRCVAIDTTVKLNTRTTIAKMNANSLGTLRSNASTSGATHPEKLPSDQANSGSRSCIEIRIVSPRLWWWPLIPENLPYFCWWRSGVLHRGFAFGPNANSWMGWDAVLSFMLLIVL